ncbi:hypothetical protein Dimus_003157 [Dionaea muscipula]
MPVFDEIPLAVDRRFQRTPAPPTDSEKTETDGEIEILEVRKGKPMVSRRSSRVASHGPIHKKNVVERESVRKTEERKKDEKLKKKVEEKAPGSDHKEPRSKYKHDKDVSDDVLLSEMLQKAKKTKQATRECEELRQQAKRKEDSRGVDPSAKKKQKTEKKNDGKKKEKEVYFDSSDFDNEGLMVNALPIDIIWRKRVIRSKIVREGWMNDNGLGNVMEIIKRQKWENLFKRREMVHIDAVKEFYGKMSVIHLKKKDVVKSSVKGVVMEFDHEKLATILGVPGKNGICEYIKDVWEESKYTKPLEITRRFANNETLTAARRVKSGSGENRRRDDEVNVPEGEAEDEEERNQGDFDWEAVVEEAAVEGGSGLGEKFYDAEDKDQGSPEVNEEIPAAAPQSSAQQKEQETSGVDPSCPTGRIPEAEMLKFQAEFERKRANRFHADLEKAQVENARLLSLLHQAQSQPKP